MKNFYFYMYKDVNKSFLLPIMKATTRRKQTCQPLKWSTAQKLLAIMRSDGEKDAVIARDRLMLAIGFYTGLRISDILQFTWLQLTDERWSIKEKKTGKIRSIDVNPALRKIAVQCEAASTIVDYEGPIFIGTRGPQTGKSMSVVAANGRIKSLFHRYDIKAENASSHTLRKTFGLRVYEANGRSEDALILLSDIFGHASIRETRRYIGITSERIKNVYLNI